MKKTLNILTALILLMIPSLAKGALTGDWQLYTSFDRSAIRAIETPGRVYFAGYPREYNTTSTYFKDPYMALFYYDKGTDEIIPMSKRDKLSENYILQLAYNTEKKYLLVVYYNYDIDLIYDDGTVRNVGTLKSANIPGKKAVNDISFSPDRNYAVLATHFGYAIIDDKNFEIAESRNYGIEMKSATIIGDRLVLTTPTAGYIGFLKDPRFSLNEYASAPELADICAIAGRGNATAAMMGRRGTNSKIYWLDFEPNQLKVKSMIQANTLMVTDYNKVGDNLNLCVYDMLYNVYPDKRQVAYSYLPSEHHNRMVASADMKTAYVMMPLDGLRIYNIDENKKWTLKKDYMRPNMPAANYSFNMVYHPRHGMLVGSLGPENTFAYDYNIAYYNHVSGLRNGVWKEYGPQYNIPNRANEMNSPYGLVIDPDNDKYIYRGSMFHGIVRINLDDPTDVLHMSRSNDSDKKDPNFVAITEPASAWGSLCRYRDPQFDAKGDLYTTFNNIDKLETEGQFMEVWRWSAANRKATTDAAHFQPLERLILKGIPGSNYDNLIVLRHSSNSNKMIIHTGYLETSHQFVIFDHNGTFTNSSDDKIIGITTAYDQDGSALNLDYANCFFEDPQTGIVWVGTNDGVFTINVRQQTSSTGTFNRIKVARNDGTSLADYLLNEVQVNGITQDAQGRKWFATAGGLVCTSNDGRRILGEFTTENSYIPSDNVFSVGYNEATGSIMVSTEFGLAELFPSGSSGSSEESDIRAYPNPVEPDYYGFVTIDGLADNVLVKIADSNGGLVRELGRAENGSIQWDLQNLEHKRVATGVYFILVSPVDKNGTGGTAGKILVLN